ncbi:unnamed protein product [Rangifer tarandus platyrhynchus]|uniref:Uncharacterized protein n=1 Tax=Rangifer tarandus platyrhynchus TaxID=3082113 RepID=A0ABN8YKP5_RANTA|nr:unnamed protein product [Rangifer tarandus platyrhynchus]
MLPPPVLEPTHSQGFSAHLALRASNMCVHSPGPVAGFAVVRFSPRASAKTRAQSVSTYVHLEVLPSAQDPKLESAQGWRTCSADLGLCHLRVSCCHQPEAGARAALTSASVTSASHAAISPRLAHVQH